MYEKLIFENHLGERIAFGENGIFVNENDLRDYAWNYSSDNGKVGNFNRGVSKKNVPIVVANPNVNEAIKAINNLMEFAEKDILADNAGKLIVGDYYLKCYIVGSKKKKYSGIRGFAVIDLDVVTDTSAWVKESRESFTLNGSSEGGKNLDFAYDFPYDFTSPNAIKSLTNTSFSDVDFKLTIYGEVDTPVIYIGGNAYKVNCYVAAGEYLTINSKEKTVTLTKNNGEVLNYFKYRDKGSYIFTPIPPGINAVSWAGNFGFDVTIYEERSEPKWT